MTAEQQPLLDPTKPNHAHAEERLRKDIIAWLGSVRPDGRPHMVPVWFLWEGETEAILVFSKPDQKIRNLKQNNHVVLGLDDTDAGEDVVSLEGEATLLQAGDVDTTLPAYVEKYTPKLQSMGWTPESMSASYTEAIRIKVTKLRA